MQNKPSLCPLLGSALAISRSVAIEEHLRVGAAGTDGIRARAEALVHGEGMPDVGLGVFPATEAGSEEAGRVPVLAMADEDTDAHIDLLGYGCDAGSRGWRRPDGRRDPCSASTRDILGIGSMPAPLLLSLASHRR
jgi:hypothetical protein